MEAKYNMIYTQYFFNQDQRHYWGQPTVAFRTAQIWQHPRKPIPFFHLFLWDLSRRTDHHSLRTSHSPLPPVTKDHQLRQFIPWCNTRTVRAQVIGPEMSTTAGWQWGAEEEVTQAGPACSVSTGGGRVRSEQVLPAQWSPALCTAWPQRPEGCSATPRMLNGSLPCYLPIKRNGEHKSHTSQLGFISCRNKNLKRVPHVVTL